MLHKLAIKAKSYTNLEYSGHQPLIWYMQKRITNSHRVHKLAAILLSQLCHDYDM